MNFMSHGKTLDGKSYPKLAEYQARMKELPKFKEAWLDDERLIKKPMKPLFAKWNNI